MKNCYDFTVFAFIFRFGILSAYFEQYYYGQGVYYSQKGYCISNDCSSESNMVHYKYSSAKYWGDQRYFMERAIGRDIAGVKKYVTYNGTVI